MNRPDLKLSLFGHLAELRTRLIRCVIAVAVLGGISLIFARPIFFVLMKPVLAALPPGGRSLIYTSGIEEINVLMKVGLYAGLFLTTPVILWQIWGFVSPGLLPQERKFAAPFVMLGSLAFMIGALFCYFVLLPTMFQFLLNTGDVGDLQGRLALARTRETEAVRYLRLGEPDRAGDLARLATQEFGAAGEGRVETPKGTRLESVVELTTRLDALGRLIDAAREGLGPETRPVLRQVMEKRLAALDAQGRHLQDKAVQLTDASAATLAKVPGAESLDLGALWSLEKQLSLGKARYAAAAWTRPLLTMSEQLTLVLMLELALGVIFELPLVMSLLGRLGIVKASWLMKYQRHAFVICLTLAAIITPTGDAINLSIMAGPMFVCYELGVLGVWLTERRRKSAEDPGAIAPAG